jgi:hypothetical protein
VAGEVIDELSDSPPAHAVRAKASSRIPNNRDNMEAGLLLIPVVGFRDPC